MELWKWELRKIWRPGILAAILLLGAVYYWMFPQFYIEYFCNGPQAEAQFTLASDWVARYGPTLEQAERAELDGQLAEELDAFARQIAAIPEAAAAGLTDYETVLSLPGGLFERCTRHGQPSGYGHGISAEPGVRRHQLVYDSRTGADYGDL